MKYLMHVVVCWYARTSIPLRYFWHIPRMAFVLLLMLGAAETGTCQFLEVQRINGLTLQYATDTFAVSNAIGGSIGGTVRSPLQTAITSQVGSGTISVLFEMPGLTDLTGTNEASMAIGVINGVPVIQGGNPATYSGASDLDWWYKPNQTELDAHGLPKSQVMGSITAGVLQAGPGHVTIIPNPLTQTGELTMSQVIYTADIGSSSHPLISANSYPPGHLPSENIDTALVSFASMGSGKLKGYVSAASLANTPLPASFYTEDPTYTSSNSMLDAFVGGATAFGFITIISAVQPDQVDPNAPVAGAGPPYTFSADLTTKVVNGCTDKNHHNVDLTTALNAAAYSVYFTFTTDRVIVPSPPSITLAVSSQWDLISVPLVVGDFAKQTLFPNASSGAFAYEGAYLLKDTLKNGSGYWLRFPAPESDKMMGDSLTLDTIPVTAGWNLIGSISTPISAASVQSDPPGMITSNFFGYRGGYVISDSIQPGGGYWVKVTNDGSLILNSDSMASAMRSGGAGRIRIISTPELPPPPPGLEISDAIARLPNAYALNGNFPNPFNPSTTIRYALPQDSRVRLQIVNTLGQVVQTLVDGVEAAGYRQVEWNASNFASGMYFARLETTGAAKHSTSFTGVIKILLIK